MKGETICIKLRKRTEFSESRMRNSMYKKMGYIIRDENDNVLFEPENIKATAEKLKKENDELKAKLEEATLYAEDADKKITKLQKENDELKAAIQAQATMRAVAPTSEDSEKKPAAKGSKKTE